MKQDQPKYREPASDDIGKTIWVRGIIDQEMRAARMDTSHWARRVFLGWFNYRAANRKLGTDHLYATLPPATEGKELDESKDSIWLWVEARVEC